MIRVPPLRPTKGRFYAFDRGFDRCWWGSMDFAMGPFYETWIEIDGVKCDWRRSDDLWVAYRLNGIYSDGVGGSFLTIRGSVGRRGVETAGPNSDVPAESRRKLFF